MNPLFDAPSYLPYLRADLDRVAALLDAGQFDVPVAACPGWTVGDLARHLGGVHRWATIAIRTGEAPPPRDDAATGIDDLAAWFREGADALLEGLSDADPAAPTWHPFPDERITAVWFRRQAHETAMHRRDMEHALGDETPIPAVLASDGIDEFLEIMLPRALKRTGSAISAGSLHLHCTDVAGEWLVWDDDGTLGMRREHAKGAAAVRGPAETILLRLWGRPATATLDVVGDTDVAAAWLDRPGR